MEKIYYSLVKKGLKTLEDVPEGLQQKVKDLLAADENA